MNVQNITKRAWIFVLALLVACFSVSLCGCTPADAPGEEASRTAALTLPYRTVQISIGDAAKVVLEQLGEDYTVQEAASCAGIGKDYVYTYPSLRLYVFAPEQGEAVVTSVCYTDDGAAINGITIGSSADAAVAALGKPTEQTESKLAYRATGAVLTLSLRDGRVSAIVLSEN